MKRWFLCLLVGGGVVCLFRGGVAPFFMLCINFLWALFWIYGSVFLGASLTLTSLTVGYRSSITIYLFLILTSWSFDILQLVDVSLYNISLSLLFSKKLFAINKTNTRSNNLLTQQQTHTPFKMPPPPPSQKP